MKSLGSAVRYASEMHVRPMRRPTGRAASALCSGVAFESAGHSRVDNGVVRHTSAGLLTDFLYRVLRDNPDISALPRPFQGF